MDNTTPPGIKYMGTNGIILLSIYFALLGILLVQNVILTWPAATKPLTNQRFVVITPPADTSKTPKPVTTYEFSLPVDTNYLQKDSLRIGLFFWKAPSIKKHPINVSLEMRFILMTLLLGALGSWLHAVSSFVDYVGNRNFVMSWLAWYMLRPFIGGVLALLFYMLLRAGMLPVNANGELPVSPYSVAAFAGLAGLFTQRASLKLAEVFDVIFSPAKGYKDPLNKKSLALTKLIPETLQMSATSLDVKIEGSEFQNPVKVYVNGQLRKSTLQGSALTVTLEANDVSQAGKLPIFVENPDGAKSNTLTLEVKPSPPSE